MQTVTTSVAFLGVLVLATAASATPLVEESRHQKELREHFHHLSYIAEYSCHHPQPRTVPVHELLSPYQTRGKAYFPEYTVLHRCDVFAGCCEGAKKCGPIHADSVHLPFKVTYLEDMGEHHKSEWQMEYVSFDNHTKCGCVDHNGYYKPEDHYHKDHEYKDHHKHEDHDHKDHHKHEDHDHHKHEEKDHYDHEDHDHKDHDHKDHDHEDRDHRPYPPQVKGPSRKDQYRPDDESYASSSERRQEPKPSNKKIDTLYITI